MSLIVGAQGPRMKLKGRNTNVEMLQATSSRKEATRGGEEMNHGTLWYSKWELGSKGSGS